MDAPRHSRLCSPHHGPPVTGCGCELLGGWNRRLQTWGPGPLPVLGPLPTPGRVSGGGWAGSRRGAPCFRLSVCAGLQVPARRVAPTGAARVSGGCPCTQEAGPPLLRVRLGSRAHGRLGALRPAVGRRLHLPLPPTGSRPGPGQVWDPSRPSLSLALSLLLLQPRSESLLQDASSLGAERGDRPVGWEALMWGLWGWLPTGGRWWRERGGGRLLPGWGSV